MIEYFFSNKNEGRDDLFQGLSIWEEEKYRKIQGTYPVIKLSFASIKDKTFQSAREKICDAITQVFQKYKEIRKSDMLTGQEKEFFDRISYQMSD